MAKTKKRWISNEEWLRDKHHAQRLYERNRNEYYKRSGIPVYAEERSRWVAKRDQARINSEADRRRRLNKQILAKVQANTVAYGADHEHLQFTKTRRDILSAIFDLACLTTDLYAAEDTIARQARCSRRSVTSCMRWFEHAGILVRTRTGGRVPGVWIVKVTNRYQIRYDRLRELLKIERVESKSFVELLKVYNRQKAQGLDLRFPSRRWGWPSQKEILAGIRNYTSHSCGKLSQKYPSDQQFCAVLSLNYNNKEPMAAFYPQENKLKHFDHCCNNISLNENTPPILKIQRKRTC